MPFRAQTRLDAGRRDRRVTIEQRSASDSAAASGFPVDGTWTTLAAGVHAERTELTGFERFQVGQETARMDTRWQTGYRADCDPELVDVAKVRRLVSDGRTYDVVAAGVVGRKRGIEWWTLASTRVA